jgi:hypothetical protein
MNVSLSYEVSDEDQTCLENKSQELGVTGEIFIARFVSDSS